MAILAQEPPETAEPPVGFWERERLLDDVDGIRPWLTDAYGLTIEPWVAIDYSKVVRGGLDTEGDAFRHVFGLDLTWETESLLGWQGGTFFLEFLNQNGQSGSDEVGDFQGVGNWDADGRTQIAEIWFRQSLFEDRLAIKVGKIDANADFAYTDYASEFINGSASTLPTNPLFPTYPDSAFGVDVFVNPVEWLYAGAGLFDGALGEGVPTGSRGPDTLFDEPADLYLMGEVGVTWTLGEGGGDAGDGRAAVGAWHHTGTLAEWAGGEADGTHGFYVLAEQTVWRENPDREGDEQGLGVFAQYDWAVPRRLRR